MPVTIMRAPVSKGRLTITHAAMSATTGKYPVQGFANYLPMADVKF